MASDDKRQPPECSALLTGVANDEDEQTDDDEEIEPLSYSPPASSDSSSVTCPPRTSEIENVVEVWGVTVAEVRGDVVVEEYSLERSEDRGEYDEA